MAADGHDAEPDLSQPPVLQVVYVSSARRPMADADLVELLDQARGNNDARGITGMLLYSDDTFMQAIEGPPEAVDALYDRILSDPRHVRVLCLRRERVAKRGFPDWNMGFRSLDSHALMAVPGFTDFLTDDSPIYERLVRSDDAVHRLLTAFRACSAMVPSLDEPARG